MPLHGLMIHLSLLSFYYFNVENNFMKKSILVLAAIGFSFLSNTYAQEKGFGLGVILGEPTGFSAKYWTAETTALDFALGYSFTSDKSLFYLNVDYVFHNTTAIQSTEDFILYYGPGARLKVREDDSRLGVRGVVGILWIPRDSRIDMFIEMAPILDVIPATKFDIAGGIGIRFFFN